MAESTLALAKTDFQASVGLFLGFGRGSAKGDPAWSSQQQAVIDECVNEGHRLFYFPEPDMDGGPTHDWSFLHPTATLDLPINSQFIVLPDDFGGVEGPVTLLGANVIATLIQFMPEPMIRQRYQELPQSTGQPQFCAITPIKGTTQVSGQRFQMLVWPQADATYTVQFQYYLIPDALSANWPYSYGGAQHASTIREACLKVAENFLDDASSTHSQEFKKRMAASMGMDRKLKPQNGGRNEDNSDNQYDRISRYWLYAQQGVLFNGVQY